MSAVETAFRSSCDRRHAGKDLLGDGVKSRVKGGEGIARSSTRLLRAILNWGYKSGSVEWDAVQAARNVQIGRDGPRDVIPQDPAVRARLRATLDGMVTPVFAGHDQVRHQQSAGCLLSCVALNRVRRRNLETSPRAVSLESWTAWRERPDWTEERLARARARSGAEAMPGPLEH